MRFAEAARRFKCGLNLWGSPHVAVGIASLLWVFLFLLAPSAAKAQVAGGSVAGTARGESGAAMPGVRLSIRDVATGEVRSVSTDTGGV